MSESPLIPAAAPPEATSLFTNGFFGVVDEEEDEMPLFVLPVDGVEVETPPLPVDDDDSAKLSGLGLTVFFEKTTSLQMQTQGVIPITPSSCQTLHLLTLRLENCYLLQLLSTCLASLP